MAPPAPAAVATALRVVLALTMMMSRGLLAAPAPLSLPVHLFPPAGHGMQLTVRSRTASNTLTTTLDASVSQPRRRPPHEIAKTLPVE